ncbi:MAG: crossover junction endodeoxyribonuclease RuvC [Candidatus Methanogaster sp.]|uniref:Crossover junction endodeoxyribonuclease RuvC n=1 Tax=Candidatus Methanogaster sp. TaxID=3386292 RepID=A0AC61L2A2_9EURY|nr:MAG: crossover junction endodeoxyribonuclease RuvC [ANME-2 cluster archaeon]
MIIGIDPGLAKTGFGIIDDADGIRCVRYGVITTPPDARLQIRVRTIFREIQEILNTHKPDELSIERLFFSRNVSSAIEVSHVRGVVLLAAAEYGIDVFEYTPNQIKQAVTGSGRADKKQMQKMVGVLLGIDEKMPADAADALAAAICHAHIR